MKLVAVLLLTLFAAAPQPAAAAELLMFEEPGCPWCARWDAEVGVVYHRTAEGERAPLRRIDLRAGVPDGVALDIRPRYSPTFVLIDDGGQEVGRIEGYPGEDFFWGLLNKMLASLPAKAADAGS